VHLLLEVSVDKPAHEAGDRQLEAVDEGRDVGVADAAEPKPRDDDTLDERDDERRELDVTGAPEGEGEPRDVRLAGDDCDAPGGAESDVESDLRADAVEREQGHDAANVLNGDGERDEPVVNPRDVRPVVVGERRARPYEKCADTAGYSIAAPCSGTRGARPALRKRRGSASSRAVLLTAVCMPSRA